MSNAVTTQTNDAASLFIEQVLPPVRLDQILSTLPSHVKPERFKRNLVIAVQAHPALLECRPDEVFAEVAKAAALGFLLDPQLGEAYLITGWNNKEGRKVPQLRSGYRGLIKLARQSGAIKNIYAHEIYEKDEFDILLGDEKRLHHKPNFAGDRGEIFLYYAVVKFEDGSSDFEPMTLGEIRKIRDRSDGWKAYKAGKIKSTPWGTDEGEMAKKTVLRRLLKRLPQSPELADALRVEDEADSRDLSDLPAPKGSGLHARLTNAKPPAPTAAGAIGFSLGNIEAATGSVIENEIPADEIDQAEEIEGVGSSASEETRGGDDPPAADGGGQADPQSSLPPEVFREFWSALCRGGSEKSLNALKEQFFKTQAKGMNLTDQEVQRLKAIFDVHIGRVNGTLSPEEQHQRMKELLA